MQSLERAASIHFVLEDERLSTHEPTIGVSTICINSGYYQSAMGHLLTVAVKP